MLEHHEKLAVVHLMPEALVTHYSQDSCLGSCEAILCDTALCRITRYSDEEMPQLASLARERRISASPRADQGACHAQARQALQFLKRSSRLQSSLRDATSVSVAPRSAKNGSRDCGHWKVGSPKNTYLQGDWDCKLRVSHPQPQLTYFVPSLRAHAVSRALPAPTFEPIAPDRRPHQPLELRAPSSVTNTICTGCPTSCDDTLAHGAGLSARNATRQSAVQCRGPPSLRDDGPSVLGQREQMLHRIRSR